MKRLSALTVLVVLLLSASNALAERPKIWIASGLSGGTYRAVYAQNLVPLLRDYTSLHRPSTGSGKNLDLLAGGQADIAFSQADVYAARLASKPTRYGGLLVIGKLADECVYIAHRKAGPVTDLHSLGAPVGGRTARIAAGDAGGGMSGTWSYLTTLDSHLSAVEVVHEGDTLALNQLAVGSFDAVGWVTDPLNFDHKMLRAALANDALAIMNLSDPKLVAALPDGTQVYNARTVELSRKWIAPKVKTICTSALMLVRKDANPALIGKLADVLSLDLKRLTRRQ